MDATYVTPSWPGQVRADDDNPCVQCSCDPSGSVSQSCVADSSQATPSMKIYFKKKKTPSAALLPQSALVS